MADAQVFLSFYFFLLKRRKRMLRRRRSSGNIRKINSLREMVERHWRSTVNSSLTIMMLYGCLSNRDVWSCFKPNHSYWQTSIQQWTSRMWVEHLRMKKETFLYLCRDLEPFLKKKRTRFRESIPVSNRIAMALWRLATGMDYRSIGQLFGVGRSTCCKITHHVCDALVTVFLKKIVSIVANERLQDTKNAFRIMSGLPQCVGAVDGCHIPILAPKENHCDYFNRKSFHSIILQAVVDQNQRYNDLFKYDMYIPVHTCIYIYIYIYMLSFTSVLLSAL